MLRVALVGYGKMGRQVEQKIRETPGIELVGIVDPKAPEQANTLNELEGSFDVIIDFSHPDNLDMIGHYAEDHPAALVVATTGYSESQIDFIKRLAGKVPIVFTANFSLGITVMARVLEQMGSALSDSFDIELIEKHHNQKLDSPSGTAKMLVNAVDPGKTFFRTFGREGNGKRQKEIGIHAIRGGNIVGEHTVLFAGEDEILEITHKATSKQVFANGAVRAAQFVAGQTPGLYDMNDVLFG